MQSATSAVAATSRILASRRCQVTVHRHSTLREYDRIHETVCEWIEQRYPSHVISLDEFCARNRYSRRSVQRALQSWGTSWREIVLDKRMEDAERRLRSSSLSVSDIAFRVGYVNTSLFTKLFKEKYGETPMVYRQEHRRKNGA